MGLATVGAHPPPVHREGAGHRHNDLLAPRPAGLGIEQLRPPFLDDAVFGLKHAQAPKALDQGGPQPAIAVFVDRTLKAARAGTVLPGAQACVAGDLAPVLEAVPIGHLALQNLAGQFA